MEFSAQRAGALLLGGDVAEATEIGAYIMRAVKGEPLGEFPIDSVLSIGVGAAVVFAAARAVGAKTIVGAALAGIGIAAAGGLVIAYQVRQGGADVVERWGARLGSALGGALPADEAAVAEDGEAVADLGDGGNGRAEQSA